MTMTDQVPREYFDSLTTGWDWYLPTQFRNSQSGLYKKCEDKDLLFSRLPSLEQFSKKDLSSGIISELVCKPNSPVRAIYDADILTISFWHEPTPETITPETMTATWQPIRKVDSRPPQSKVLCWKDNPDLPREQGDNWVFICESGVETTLWQRNIRKGRGKGQNRRNKENLQPMYEATSQ